MQRNTFLNNPEPAEIGNERMKGLRFAVPFFDIEFIGDFAIPYKVKNLIP